jgi:hypothetical protein
MEDTSILEIGDLGVSVETAGDSKSLAALSLDNNILADLEVTTLHIDIELLATVEAKSFSRFTILELHGEDTHTDQV